MIDQKGYRLNVGIVLANKYGQLFWGKRVKTHGWQFPQGGVQPYETLEETMYRELTEETGLRKRYVKILATTKRWLYYQLPIHMRAKVRTQNCIGQKQKWFLLLLTSDDIKIVLDSSKKPEFNDWCWIDYWKPITQVIYFKRSIYLHVLKEFGSHIRSKLKITLPSDAGVNIEYP